MDTAVKEETLEPLDVRFKYHGVVRHVSNAQLQNSCLKGYEIRRGGKFSFKVKAYSFDKIESVLDRIKIQRRDTPEVPTQHSVLIGDRLRLSEALRDAS